MNRASPDPGTQWDGAGHTSLTQAPSSPHRSAQAAPRPWVPPPAQGRNGVELRLLRAQRGGAGRPITQAGKGLQVDEDRPVQPPLPSLHQICQQGLRQGGTAQPSNPTGRTRTGTSPLSHLVVRAPRLPPAVMGPESRPGAARTHSDSVRARARAPRQRVRYLSVTLPTPAKGGTLKP